MQDITITEPTELTPIMQDIYRRIRTNVEFTGIENRVICVTSSMPDEGKSTVSYQLAKALANNNKGVLLVDADMRNSVLHKQLNFSHSKSGLSHYLAGKLDLSDVIYKTNVDRLYLIPTGKFAKNPTELLANERFPEMIKYLKNVFDYVIIDTPPLGAVIDAAVVAKECDGSILVIAANKSKRRAIQNVKNQLAMANPNILGAILNQVDVKNRTYGRKYGYGYGYGETYGYGQSGE